MATLSNVDAEASALGCIFCKPEIIGDVSEKLKPEDFYSQQYRVIYACMIDLYLQGKPIDSITVQENLSRHGDLERVGGGMNIMNLVAKEPTAVYVNDRIETILDYRKRRDLVKLATVITSNAKDMSDGNSPEKICEKIEDWLIARDDRQSGRSYITSKEMAMMMDDAMSERMDRERRAKEVIYTSFKTLNRLTGGFERGDLIILSAASGVGKSAFSANVARDIAVTQKRPLLYLNSEMGDKQQALRYASILSGVSHRMLRQGLPQKEEIPDGEEDPYVKVMDACTTMKHGKLFTITIPDLQISNVVAETRRMKERFGIEMAIVDYVGRMDTLSKDAQEWQIMESAARTLKTMAQELHIVVMMVAQLSSNGQSLAKSSSMKNECDLWLNLSRITPEMRARMNQFGNGVADYWNVVLEFRKARNVETGAKIPMHFHGDTLTFTDDDAQAEKFYEQEKKEGGVGESKADYRKSENFDVPL